MFTGGYLEKHLTKGMFASLNIYVLFGKVKVTQLLLILFVIVLGIGQ